MNTSIKVLTVRTNRQGGIYCEAAPLGLVWVVSRHMYHMDAVEVRPLTVRHLCWYLVRNQAVWAYWRGWRLLYRGGFLNTPEGCRFNWRQLRIPPWATRWWQR